MFTHSQIDWYMSLAYEQAEQAAWNGEVPVGAVIVDKFGKVVSTGQNRKEVDFDATAHAELLAIREAGKSLGGWRLLECSLFVTLEPCPMCLSAILQSRLETLYFGAYDSKGGAISLGYSFQQDTRFNHSFRVMGGVEHYRCSKQLSDFFRARRKGYC
jgi:tRNA(adenine34) deaminase